MQTSGHVSAQIAQPVQSSGRANVTATYPCLLMALPVSMHFFGQAGTHSSHALHRSKSISILPVAMTVSPFSRYRGPASRAAPPP